MPVDVNGVILGTLRHSARIRAISDNALVAETAITRACAEFDVHAFVESKFVRTSVPTGSELDAGFDVPRLREEDWFYSAGFRRKNRHGGRFEAAQRIGLRDSNSEFFFPDDQGNSRLTLSYNQPLLNGAGKAYNTSLIVLAKLDTRIASDRTAEQLQDHLQEVTDAFWEIYLQRAVLVQKQRHLERAEVILRRLEGRRDVDSLESQIARARAAVAMRRTELIRAITDIRNAEARLRSLVNSPEMLSQRDAELLPVQPPLSVYVPVNMKEALVAALENRPEIDAAAQEIDAARVRLNVAKNELLPVLDLVLETYVSGLRGNFNVGRSWVDQFSVGEPSYTAGFVFEVPIHRRAARANHQRRRVELRQLTSQFQATIETLHAEVEVGRFGEVNTAYADRNFELLRTQSVLRFWMPTLGSACQIAILGFGGRCRAARGAQRGLVHGVLLVRDHGAVARAGGRQHGQPRAARCGGDRPHLRAAGTRAGDRGPAA